MKKFYSQQQQGILLMSGVTTSSDLDAILNLFQDVSALHASTPEHR